MTPDIIKVDLWQGPLTTDPTFEPISRYCEAFWLPIIGPTPLFAARRLFTRATIGAYEQPLDVFAQEMGFGPHNPKGAKRIWESLERLVGFRLARWDEPVFSVLAAWPLLHPRQVERLPEHLRKQARPPEPPCLSSVEEGAIGGDPPPRKGVRGSAPVAGHPPNLEGKSVAELVQRLEDSLTRAKAVRDGGDRQ